MDKQHQIITINRELPSKISSYRLLDEIYGRVKPSLESVKREVDKPLILYGAGNLGKMAKQYFDKLGIPILHIMDKNNQNYTDDIFWNKVKVFCINDHTIEINKEKCLIVVCIVTSSYQEVASQLKSKGWKNIVPFYDITLAYTDKHPLQNGWITSLLDNKDMEGMEYVLSKLQDNISCAHYLQFIAYHSLREEWIFKDATITNDNRYFIPEIVNILNNHENFVDIGAHHGEVCKKFIITMNNKFNYINNTFDSIYAFESDNKNINKFVFNVKKHVNEEDIYIIKSTLGSKKERKKFFSGLDYISQLSKLGQEEIEVHKLDDFKLSPTFVKIHTEGNEDDVIKGGLETIKKSRPIIVTTVYHNRKGLWQLPKLLIDLLENYIFYFRLHSWYGTGAVIYAIPRERIK